MSSCQVSISGAAFSPEMTRAQIYSYVKTYVAQFGGAADLL
jgi:hypothetical protein